MIWLEAFGPPLFYIAWAVFCWHFIKWLTRPD